MIPAGEDPGDRVSEFIDRGRAAQQAINELGAGPPDATLRRALEIVLADRRSVTRRGLAHGVRRALDDPRAVIAEAADAAGIGAPTHGIPAQPAAEVLMGDAPRCKATMIDTKRPDRQVQCVFDVGHAGHHETLDGVEWTDVPFPA